MFLKSSCDIGFTKPGPGTDFEALAGFVEAL